MPLKTKTCGKHVISVDINDDEWEKLRRELRKSKNLLNFNAAIMPYVCEKENSTPNILFIGKKSRDWKPETYGHLKIKEYSIRFAGQRNGKRSRNIVSMTVLPMFLQPTEKKGRI